MYHVQVLRPGNYVLVTWDLDMVGSSIYQVGCDWSAGHNTHL